MPNRSVKPERPEQEEIIHTNSSRQLGRFICYVDERRQGQFLKTSFSRIVGSNIGHGNANRSHAFPKLNHISRPSTRANRHVVVQFVRLRQPDVRFVDSLEASEHVHENPDCVEESNVKRNTDTPQA